MASGDLPYTGTRAERWACDRGLMRPDHREPCLGYLRSCLQAAREARESGGTPYQELEVWRAKQGAFMDAPVDVDGVRAREKVSAAIERETLSVIQAYEFLERERDELLNALKRIKQACEEDPVDGECILRIYKEALYLHSQADCARYDNAYRVFEDLHKLPD